MATFTFENGYQQDAKTKGASRRKRASTKRMYNAPCNCFDLELQCFHKVKERTTSQPDAVKIDSQDSTPAWNRYHAVERNQNTQRHKTA